MIVRHWGDKTRTFTWHWEDPKGWKDSIGFATPDGYGFHGHAGQFTAPAHALAECEPEIRAAHLRIAAGDDLADLATHVLEVGRTGTFLPITTKNTTQTHPETTNRQENAGTQEAMYP